MVTIPTLISLLLLFMSSIITQSNLYPNCATNDTQSNSQTCHIELSECTDTSCNYFTANSQIYCPNITSCNTICSLHLQQPANLCTYISSQFQPTIYQYTNSISSIYCTTININPTVPTTCQLTKYTPNPTQSTTYISTSNKNNDLVIRLDQNTLLTIIVLTIICLLGCVICCIARTCWKYHKKTTIPTQNHHNKPHNNHDNDKNINKNDMNQEIHIAMSKVNNNICKQNDSLTSSSSSPSITASNDHSKNIILKHPKYNHQSEPPPIIYKNYPQKISLQYKRSLPPNYVQPQPTQHSQKHQYSQRTSYPSKKKKKTPIKYHHVRMENVEHHQIRNVTMIGDGERTSIQEIIGTHMYIERGNIDSFDSDDDIGPHIINDEESYMHSLTLAQVENATATHKDYDELHPRHQFIDGIPEIFPHNNNEIHQHKTMVSNPFHIESHRSDDLKLNETHKSQNIIDFMASVDDDSMHVQITPRTPMHLDLSSNTINTAIVHVSRGTFEHSQTGMDIDISTLKISDNKDLNEMEMEEDMRSHDSNVLKNKLSEKLKKLQKQQFEHEETVSVTPRQMHALGHESGASPSDLQEYFARLAVSKHHKHELAMVSPTMTQPTCKSSTVTETFYYKENDLNVEHHILMPALDEKDSADYDKSSSTKKTNTNINESEMNVLIDNTKEMIDEIKDNKSMITPQLLSKPPELDDIYIQQMKSRLEINDNDNNNNIGNNNNLYITSNNEINIDDIDLNTASIMSSTTPLEYRTSDEDVLHDKNSLTS